MKRKPYTESDFRPRQRSEKNMVQAILSFGDHGYFRDNLFGSELIWGDTRYVFPSRRGLKSMKNLYIFAMVKKDAATFIKKNKVKQLAWQPSVVYNKKHSKTTKPIIGYDIDSAYWQIARKMRVISKNTFDRGMNIKEKHLLLAALSSLGRDKRYESIDKGSFTRDVLIIKGDDQLKNLYKKIRYACFRHMKKIATMLGDTFVAYKTDCIYCLYSQKNIRIIEKYLDLNGLEYKVVSDYANFGKTIYD